MLRWVAVALMTSACIASPCDLQAGMIRVLGVTHATGHSPVQVTGTINGSSITLDAGEMRAYDASGATLVPLIADYCLNAGTSIDGVKHPDAITGDGTVNGLTVHNAKEIAWLIQNVGIALHPLTSSGAYDDKAALQAAIWHLGGLNGPSGTAGTFDLDPSSSLIGQYNIYLGLAAAHQADLNSVLWITVNDAGQIFQGQVASNPVPEPSSMCLLGFGLLGLIGYQRSRLRKSVA